MPEGRGAFQLVRNTAGAVMLGLGLLAGCADDTPSAGSERDESTRESATRVECGSSTYDDGHQVIRYCERGSVEVRLEGSATAEVAGSKCEAHGDFVTANFGTNYSNPKAAEGNYVGFLAGGLERDDESGSSTLTQVVLVLDGDRLEISDAAITGALTPTSLDATVTGTTPNGEVEIVAVCPVR